MKFNNTDSSNCPDKIDLISFLIDNEGNPDDIYKMQLHIRKCAICSDILEEYKISGELISEHRGRPVYLSSSFTANVMGAVTDTGYNELFDDILGLSKKVVAACTIFIIIMLSIMMFPEEGAMDAFTIEEFVIVNGDDGEVLIKDEVTYDDVVSLAFTQY